MADKRLKTRIQLLKNTDSYFSNLNPVTLNGEIYLVETDAGIKVKIGNGSAYNNLPYYEDSLLYTLGFDSVTGMFVLSPIAIPDGVIYISWSDW